MDQALANARYGQGEVLAALRPVLRLETAYAAGTVDRRIGELAAARARHGAAAAAYRQALASLDEALGQVPDDVAAHNEKGWGLFRLGALRAALSDHAVAERAYSEAIAAYGEALARAPDHVDAHMN
jgi:tetratricopeptide (TPR) repeat protein